MDDMKFELNKEYIINASGFPIPIRGKLVDYETVGDDVILKIDTGEANPVNVLVSSITGWQRTNNKSIAA